MVLLAKATVEAAPNFLENMEATHQFFILQDAESAASRLGKLKAELRHMVQILAWSPSSGRTARFFNTKSAQARLKAEAVIQLAEQAGLPELREYIVGQHIVLYAHSETSIVLLALKNQRQLIYLSE
jgi:hypothetical protein